MFDAFRVGALRGFVMSRGMGCPEVRWLMRVFRQAYLDMGISQYDSTI